MFLVDILGCGKVVDYPKKKKVDDSNVGREIPRFAEDGRRKYENPLGCKRWRVVKVVGLEGVGSYTAGIQSDSTEGHKDRGSTRARQANQWET